MPTRILPTGHINNAIKILKRPSATLHEHLVAGDGTSRTNRSLKSDRQGGIGDANDTPDGFC
jgi:hypothetical protein